jgi:hypothetical protein
MLKKILCGAIDLEISLQIFLSVMTIQFDSLS